MIRTLNFTGRKRIPRDAARITLRSEPGGSVTFDAELGLAGFALPPDAQVFIEAAFKTTFMRFGWGTVSKLTPPDDRRLSRLAQPELASFRVKVVEPAASGPGLLLAVADHIAPEGLRGGEKRRMPLFRVSYTPGLTDKIWHLNLDSHDGGGPILELQQMPGIRELVRQEAFMALVFPETVRQVFDHIFSDDGIDDPQADPQSWQARWLLYGAQLAHKPNPQIRDGRPDPEHNEWIDSVVSAWSQRHKIVANFKRRFAGTEAALP